MVTNNIQKTANYPFIFRDVFLTFVPKLTYTKHQKYILFRISSFVVHRYTIGGNAKDLNIDGPKEI